MPFPQELPREQVSYLIGLLTKSEKFEADRAIEAAYDVVGYLLGAFVGAGDQAAFNMKAQRVTRKQVADALGVLTAEGEVQAQAGIPSWLLPILLQLLERWLAGRQ